MRTATENCTPTGIQKQIEKIGKKKKYAALSVLNQIIPALYDGLVERFGEEHVHVCAGYETRAIREGNGLHKDPCTDAMCIASFPIGQAPYLGQTPVYEIRQYRRHNHAIISNQRERTCKLDGETVARNWRPRFRQEGLSLEDYLQDLPEEERRAVCSRLQVIPSVRYCNDPKRQNMPGYVFLYNGKRHIMSGQRTNGKYLLALGDKKTNYRAGHCRVIRMGGLVYV